MRSNANAIHREGTAQTTKAARVQLLLSYLPPDTASWDGLLAAKRAAYQQFCQEMIVDPKQDDAVTVVHDDHPLSQNSDSRWNAYFKVMLTDVPDPQS